MAELASHPTVSEAASLTARAIQLGERIDLNGLEREDAFSKIPLAFCTGSGTAVLFKSGTAVLVGLSSDEEQACLHRIRPHVIDPIAEPETETARIVVRPGEQELLGPAGELQLRGADNNRILLVAQALAMSTSLAWDERRIAQAFDRIQPLADVLQNGRLPSGRRSEQLAQIGEALAIQHRLASRTDLDDKPDLLWDRPELERLWVRLVEEYDLPARGRAIERKLHAIQETSETLTDLLSTRTSHRLEWYIIILILIEIVLGLYDRFLK